MYVQLGGYNGSRLLSSTEVFANGAFTPGASLPVPMSGHCMIKINETHSIVTGGHMQKTYVSIVSSRFNACYISSM